ncbi:thioredoxin-dependent thiol peroxidase [Specibacter sp. NPDC057265]|uniref:thioredoxin-dependent thiol peroxidase n=1 Tax=Specibacter sp. NPDC057265 TaxID=3346075 RepID=UPI00362A0BF2
MTTRLVPGDAAPLFSLPTAGAGTTSLTDFAGQRVILFFYPAAMTPGCTKEACDFRDNLASLQSHGYQVLGISPDPVAKLEKFAARDGLSYPLLSDEDHAVALAYGAWGEKKNYGKSYQGLIRSTVVIGPEGGVEVAQYNVRATGHVAKLRRDLKIADAPAHQLG